MKNDLLRISVITPNYNYSCFISDTIESVIDQHYNNYEHIIVDDGSTDNSVSIIKSYISKSNGHLKLICTPKQGQTKALNLALSKVSGDIICWLNSDDKLNIGAFATINNSYKLHPQSDAIFGDIHIIDADNNIKKNLMYLKFDYLSGVFNGFGKVIPSNAIFWRSFLTKEIGQFNPDFNYAMDSEYWSRLLYKKIVYHVPAYLAQFRYHNKSKTIKRRTSDSKVNERGKFEDKMVFIASYNRLNLSRIVPIKYSFFLNYYFKFKRHLLKLIHGHYRW